MDRLFLRIFWFFNLMFFLLPGVVQGGTLGELQKKIDALSPSISHSFSVHQEIDVLGIDLKEVNTQREAAEIKTGERYEISVYYRVADHGQREFQVNLFLNEQNILTISETIGGGIGEVIIKKYPIRIPYIFIQTKKKVGLSFFFQSQNVKFKSPVKQLPYQKEPIVSKNGYLADGSLVAFMEDGNPEYENWTFENYSGPVKMMMDDNVSVIGNSSVLVDYRGGEEVINFHSLYQSLKLKNNEKYKLRFYIKEWNMKGNFPVFEILDTSGEWHPIARGEKTGQAIGDWFQYEINFNSGNLDSVLFRVIHYPNQQVTEGSFWIDGVTLTKAN